MSRRLLRALACTLPLAFGTGCSEAPPSAPAPTPPPESIRSVSPPARGTGVPYDSGIQAEFVPALDPSSIDSTTVFMKLDLARQPITLRYDAASRVLHITPRVTLKLLRTYTIEITSRVRTTAGVSAVPGGTFWQFTTNTVRRPAPTFPADGITNESPYVSLRWTATEAGVGTVNYDVYVSDDSLALAGGAVPRLARIARAYQMPTTRWGFERRLYWKVDAVNLTSGESLSGAISRFTTLPANTPIDSATAILDRWGYNRRVNNQVFCDPGSMFTNGTGDYNSVMHWQFPASQQPWRLADAYIQMQSNTQNWVARRPSVYMTREPWSGCSSLTQFSPTVEPGTELALGGPGFGLDWVLFRSEYLTAYFEAAARNPDTGALQFFTTQLMTYNTSDPINIFRGAVRFYYYKVPPPAAPATPR